MELVEGYIIQYFSNKFFYQINYFTSDMSQKVAVPETLANTGDENKQQVIINNTYITNNAGTDKTKSALCCIII